MPRNRKERIDPDDDGRTIADMNIEGMPWYVRDSRDREDTGSDTEHYQMTKEEARMYTWAAIKAGLLIALVFIAAFGVFIALLDFLWFA